MVRSRSVSILAAAALALALQLSAAGGPAHAAVAGLGSMPLTPGRLSAIASAVDKQSRSFSGVRAIPRQKRLEIYYPQPESAVTDLAGSMRMINRAADQGTSPPTGQQWTVTLVPATYSLFELQSVLAQIPTAQPWASLAGPLLASWGIDVAANRVDVGLTQVTPTLTAAAVRQFGGSVELQQQARPRSELRRVARSTSTPAPASESCSDLFDCAPYSAGDRIVSQQGYYNISCTAGFAAEATSGQVGMLSAAHCGSNGTAWYQGYVDSANQIYASGLLGETIQQTFGGAGDYELEDATAYGSRVQGYVWAGAGRYPVTALAYSISGYDACVDGSFSGENCSGRIGNVDECINEIIDGSVTTICNVVEITSTNGQVECRTGDSGGPVFDLNANGTVDAQGIIDAGVDNAEGEAATCYYTDIVHLASNLLLLAG
ncbi:MAG: hypothetical protein ACREQM_11385 [Candidatus Dormibacteraceae bacterium]